MNKELVVVGIGSSAGGLEALQIMLTKIPEIPNCAYIIAQHLSPTHKSMMVELLSRTTNIPVIEAKNGLKIKSKSIYMTPENTDIYVKDGKIYLKSIEQSFGPKPSVNYFLSSLASDFSERAIGIILSGTGSDGAYGIRAIKAQGGITIAQAPATAKYDGMPLSAINTGKVDLVVSIDNLGEEIERIVNSIDKNIGLSLNDRILNQIYRILFDTHGVDFSLYKKNTLIRRVERRLAALKIDSFQEYLQKIENSSEEITNLYHDILIGVTSFFRDKEAFEQLQTHIENLISKKEQGEEIRFWSIGCSTGEEAYSLAIILSEILKEKINKYKIKIFATDIDDEALKIARSGIYAETSLEGVDKKIIQRYFSVQKNQFEIKKSLRELVIFSKHNIIGDSPFLRLDLISCRNLLIYFSNNLQNKFFPIVHYSLRENGLLFLGKSESIGQHIDLFNLMDKSTKIFRAQYTGIKEPPRLYNYSTAYKAQYDEPKLRKIKNEEEFLEDKVSEAIRELVLKQCVVINSSNDIVYIKGDIPFLKFQEGRISNNIFKLLNDELSLDLRSAITKAAKEKKVQTTPYRSIMIFEDIIRYVKAIITPIQDEKSDDFLYVIFFQSEETQNIKGHIIADGDESEIVEKLTIELDSTKSHLQNVIEELETSYEEMQSLNEELQSSNEELQSSNEELETTNEELQSTNEELQTAYSELRVLYEDKDKRTRQLEELTSKLSEKTNDYRKQKEITEAILDTTPIAVTMVNIEGEITYINSFAENLYGVSKKDILKRDYNSMEWRITSFEGDDFSDDELPFSIIKRTYEPVYNIKHVIENDSNKLYISISGAPLFDVEGKFIGAVFCIEDQTSKFNMQNDLEYYQSSTKPDLEINTNCKDNELFELSILDINTDVRNNINDLLLNLNTINSKDKKITQKLDVANDIIQNLSKTLDEKVQHYTQKIKYEKTNIRGVFLKHLELFEQLFKDQSIEYNNDISNTKSINFNSKVINTVLYALFNFLFKEYNIIKNKKLKIGFKDNIEKDLYQLEVCIENISLQKSKKDIENNYKTLSKDLMDCNIQSDIKIGKNIILKIDFKGN